MRKDRSAAVVKVIVLATAVFNLFTAGLNLWLGRAKQALPAPGPALVQQACPAPVQPQVIQYLNVPAPSPGHAKEPYHPAGQ